MADEHHGNAIRGPYREDAARSRGERRVGFGARVLARLGDLDDRRTVDLVQPRGGRGEPGDVDEIAVGARRETEAGTDVVT